MTKEQLNNQISELEQTIWEIREQKRIRAEELQEAKKYNKLLEAEIKSLYMEMIHILRDILMAQATKKIPELEKKKININNNMF